jgi:hypothetical protein
MSNHNEHKSSKNSGDSNEGHYKKMAELAEQLAILESRRKTQSCSPPSNRDKTTNEFENLVRSIGKQAFDLTIRQHKAKQRNPALTQNPVVRALRRKRMAVNRQNYLMEAGYGNRELTPEEEAMLPPQFQLQSE